MKKAAFFLFILLLITLCAAFASADSIVCGPSFMTAPLLMDQSLYGVTADGLVRLPLDGSPQQTILSAAALESTFSDTAYRDLCLAAYKGEIILFDLNAVYLLGDQGLSLLVNVDNADDMVYSIEAAACAGDYLFLLPFDASRLFRINLLTGEMNTLPPNGLTELAVWQDNQLLGLRRSSTSVDVVIVDQQGAFVQTVCSFDQTSFPKYLAAEPQEGRIYLIANGKLTEIRDGQALSVYPVPTDFTSFYQAYAGPQQYILLNSLTDTAVVYDVTAQPRQTKVTIAGMNTSASLDGSFFLAYPDLVIDRTIREHCCAQEVFTAVQSGDDTVDLYLVPLSTGIRRLMEQGYLAPLNDCEALADELTALYPVFSEALQYNGEPYACIDSLYLSGWTMSAELAEDMEAPETITQAMENQLAWVDHPLNNGIPYLAEAFHSSEWDAERYLDYILKQYILWAEDTADTLDFSDPCFAALLASLRQAVSRGLPLASAAVYADVSQSAALVGNNININVSGASWRESRLIIPPGLWDGDAGRVQASVSVYILNPNSKHKEEALTYLSYLVQNRSASNSSLLYATAESVPYGYGAEIESQLTELEALLETASPSETRSIQNQISDLQASLSAMAMDAGAWIIYGPALEAYRNSIIPQVRLGLSLYLEGPQQGHLDIFSTLTQIVWQYLYGSISLEQCVQRLNSTVTMISLEGGISY